MYKQNSCRKILLFTLGAIGGAERMSLTIGKLLGNSDKFDVEFVILGDDRRILDFMPGGYGAESIPFNTKSVMSVFRIYRKIRQAAPDVVFGTQARINPQIIAAARFAGKKVIVRSSGMVGDYTGLKFWMVKLLFRFAHRVIAQQDQMRLEIIDKCHVNPDNVVTIKNLLDIDTIRKKIDSPSPYGKDKGVNFVNVARVAPGKAQDIAIRAFSIVHVSMPDANLYFVGPQDEDKKEYNQELLSLIRELNLVDSVHFVGYVDNPYVWVRNCDCFVFPSRKEGLPNALIEASYLGIPCVASRCLDIIGEIIEDGYNGYTFAVDDVEGLADGMVKALKLKDFKMIYKPSLKENYIELFESVR